MSDGVNEVVTWTYYTGGLPLHLFLLLSLLLSIFELVYLR